MSSQLDLNKFNAFLDAAAKTIACGPECQQQKKKDELKERYDTAEDNLTLAEPQYQIAKQQYYTFSAGQSGYEDMMETEYREKATTVLQSFSQTLDEALSKLNTQLDTYKGLLVNYRNVVDLQKQYQRENAKLFQQWKTNTHDILTNERKTFYEDQQIGVLNGYYQYFLWTAYVLTIACFAAFSLLYPSSFGLRSRIVILGALIALPFISTWLLGKVIQIVYWIIGLLPKNVYTQLDHV